MSLGASVAFSEKLLFFCPSTQAQVKDTLSPGFRSEKRLTFQAFGSLPWINYYI